MTTKTTAATLAPLATTAVWAAARATGGDMVLTSGRWLADTADFMGSLVAQGRCALRATPAEQAACDEALAQAVSARAGTATFEGILVALASYRAEAC